MKHFIVSIGLILQITIVSSAQPQIHRQVRPENLGEDSVALSFDEDYLLIEDSCAAITRYAHYDFTGRRFYGKFRDVSRANPDIVVSEGTYSVSGLKEGDFTTHYFNGTLQTKLNYKNNKLNGRGEVYYEDGKQKLTFDANNNDYSIIDAWDQEGNKTVDNGKGRYKVTLGAIYWTGKLINGRPEGKWEAFSLFDRTNEAIASEKFRDNKFQKGTNPIGSYSDSSLVVLVNEKEFLFIKAERMAVSHASCHRVKRKQIINAQYRDGANAFAQRIVQLVSPYLNKINLKPFNTELTIEGKVSENGFIGGLRFNSALDNTIAKGIIDRLRMLPLLEPALVDGKRSAQRIVIQFRFNGGMYTLSYRVLPIDTD